MRRALALVLLLLAVVDASADTCPTGRTPNLCLKPTAQQLLNDNFIKIDDWVGRHNLTVLDVTQPPFNVPNDGRDVYTALQAVATFVNTRICANGQGITIRFPPGTYRIDQHKTGSNGIEDIAWGPGCNGLHFEGYGARIEVKGNFQRTSTSINALSPFWIKSNTNVTFEGFIVDGNNTETTETSGFTEGDSHCFKTKNASDSSPTAITNVIIRNAQFINCSVDGILIGNSNPIDRNVLIENVVVDGASRNGIAIIQARGVTIRNSWILNTGTAAVDFDPRSGLDIEPNGCKTGSGLCSLGVAILDDNTGDITIDNVQFYNNVRSHFVTQLPYVENVTITGSSFIDGPDTTGSPIGLVCNNCTLRDSYVYANVDASNSHLILQSTSNTTRCRNLVENTTIDSVGRGIWIVTQACDTTVRNSRLRYIGAGTLTNAFPQVQVAANGRVVWEGNTVYIPATAHDGLTNHAAVTMTPSSGRLYARNNYFTTDAGSAFNDVCTAAATPWTCCSGADAGTCDASLFYSVNYAGTGIADIRHDCFSPTANFFPFGSSTYTAEDQCYSQGFTDEALQVYFPTRTTIAADGAGTAAAFTITPDGVDGVSGSLHLITCSDTDGCAGTLAETDIPAGAVVIIVNLSTNSVGIADSAGVQETTGGVAVALAQYEPAAFLYTGDRWTLLFTN